MTEPRYCKDCRWFKDYFDAELCERPNDALVAEPVHGWVMRPDAWQERQVPKQGEDRCGPIGKYWQYAASWWQR